MQLDWQTDLQGAAAAGSGPPDDLAHLLLLSTRQPRCLFLGAGTGVQHLLRSRGCGFPHDCRCSCRSSRLLRALLTGSKGDTVNGVCQLASRRMDKSMSKPAVKSLVHHSTEVELVS